MAAALSKRIETVARNEKSEDPPKLKNFVFAGKLGQGGFGTVWRFFDPDLGRDFALKRMALLQGTDDAETVSGNAFKPKLQKSLKPAKISFSHVLKGRK